jgi:hypothetical protein
LPIERRLLSARARGRLVLGGERGALGGDILAGVLRQEALVHQGLLSLGQLFLLLRQGLDASRLGFVGLVLQRDVAGIDHGHQVAGLDPRSSARQNLGDRPATSAPIFGSASTSRVPSVSRTTSKFPLAPGSR